MATETRLTKREVMAWRAFAEMQEALHGRIDQQLTASSGLSSADYTVLAVLAEAPDGRLRALRLGQLLQWEKSRLHHQLTRMCQRGLAERLTGEGRTSYAAISESGRRALEAAAPAHSRQLRQLVFERITEEQVQQLGDISRAILDGLDRDLSE